MIFCLPGLGQAYFQSMRQQTQQKELMEVKRAAPVMLEKYRELYAADTDMVGWLAVEGIMIDYPVMQCADN